MHDDLEQVLHARVLTSVLRLSLAWANAIAHILSSAELGMSELCTLDVLTLLLAR